MTQNADRNLRDEAAKTLEEAKNHPDTDMAFSVRLPPGN
jgi:hypothetical protein